jgi:peptidyl-dipeptidase Dcp
VNPKETSDMPIPVAPAAVAVLLSAATPQNPLLAPWTGPFGGVPPFDQVKVEQFVPALEAGFDALMRDRGFPVPAAPRAN